MAQSATTVTPPNPTPPTNMGSGIANAGTPPTAAYASTVYNDPWKPGNPSPTGPQMPNTTPSTLPPFLDDGAAGTLEAFAAPNSGTAAEGAGTEVVVTATVPNPSPAGQLKTVSDLGDYVGGANSINAQHASSLSPATNPALSSIAPTTAVSGASGTDTITCTGTNFTRQSVVYRDGIAMPTTFVSATSITAAVSKRATAGASVISVRTGGVVETVTKPLTYT